MELGNIWASHKVKILAFIGAFSLVAVSVGIYFFILATQPKQVTLTIDGVSKPISTQAETVEELLSEQQLTIKPQDVLIPDIHTPITEAMTVELQTSLPVAVQVDGQTKTVHSVKRDVSSVLKEAGITLRELDKVTPARTATITKDTKISVIRVDEKVVQVPKQVPFQEIRKADANLTKGETKVVQQGQEGKAVDHYKVVLEDGKEVGRQLVKTEVVQPKADRILAIGTKKKDVVVAASESLTSRGGKSFRARRVLTGVTLTAYSAHGGGKAPGSAGFGRTATGVRAAEGRTIAVDPSVVPLGWWVYIDGVGYRRAEDTGGAVKGHKMDIYFNSRSEAMQFGRKRGKTVYIIGPKLE
ncbi:3D domain-containing protein [Brevibacillus dissolubilis]|uniref:3D domain-containing protein n=1 Tax=Brevibacillus dissolubilis TaxID=1844116 RepID=UPI0011164728|nr:3D domain-containing protein [Brevibacillus dissolubilis]